MIQHHLVNSYRKTFQNRFRRIEDDGADFEAFVFECFRYAREEAGFARRLARGRDGAIDLLDRLGESGAATIAECKYVGSGLARDAAARWGDVATKLRTHLPPLAADSAKNPSSPYRGWLDPQRPVTRYRFCVTAEMTNEEVAGLEREIAGFFAELVAEGIGSLRALAANRDGNVRVLRWDWFAAELNAHPSLDFRWFRGLPVGVELFDPETGTRATFRDFLRSGELRYFSRDEYSDLRIGTVEGGEADLTDTLADGDVQALLISGPGGVGKTRLTWELSAALANDGKGFDVYSLGRSTGFESIAELATRYPEDASILLLFDYAEAARNLGEVADAVEYVLINTGHRMRLLATCRASAANAVRDALGMLQVREKTLGSGHTGELSYAEWVARSILGLEDLPARREVEQVCRGVPALAAFALFLYRHHRSRFDAQFGALHGVVDFDRWAAHRISALVERTGRQDPSAERTLALVALSLPMPIDDFRQFEAANRPLVGGLRDDRWIEQEGDHYVAAHDVLADSLAARWLFESESAATDRAADLLVETAYQGRLERGLIGIERLAPHPKFGAIEGSKVVASLLDRHSEQVARNLRLLLSGSLLSFREKLDLLHETEILKRKADGDRSIDAPLSALAEHAAKQRLDPTVLPSLATLLDLLDHALTGEQSSNMVLRRAYALDPARFRERAFRSIRYFPASEPTHFLLVQMLKSGECTDTLESAVRYWADSNLTAPRASFLYRAWLDRGGSLEAVERPLLTWVAKHETSFEAEFVYKAWLDRGGSIEAVEKPLLTWVAEHGTSFEAEFIYDAWLDRGGSIEMVEKPLLAWVAEHRTAPGASHVYKAWLDRGGSIEAVEEPLLAWVAEHGTALDAQFLYNAWLDRGGSIEAVEKPLLTWVAQHRTAPEASHVYKAWLDRGASIEAIEEPLLAWVAEHGTALAAKFVYCAMLNRGSIKAIEKPLLAWVAEYGTTREASYVYRSWLGHGGDFEPIREQVNAWVVQWHRELDMAFVTRRLCKRHDLPEPVVLSIARWSAAFSGHEDSLDRLATLLGHVRYETLSEAGFLRLIALVEDAIGAGLTQERLSDVDRSHLWAISVSLARGPLFGSNPRGCLRAIARIVKSGRIFSRGLETSGAEFLLHTYDLMLNAALNAVRWGELSVEQDADALRAFVEWIRCAEQQIEGWERLLSPPSPIGDSY